MREGDTVRLANQAAMMNTLTCPSSLDIQVGGGHYKEYRIQPVEYIYKNNIPYFEGNVIKYVTRWKDKGGVSDLEKAKHYIDLLIELEGGEYAAIQRAG